MNAREAGGWKDRPAGVLIGLISVVAGCSTTDWRTAPHDRVFMQTPAPILHPLPPTRNLVHSWYGVEHAVVRPIATGLNPGSWIDHAIGTPEPLDVNAFGEVIDSSWFVNRIGRKDLTAAEVARGPNRDGPAPGPLYVLGGKSEGPTPGLLVKDSRGTRFLVKFDPPAYPHLASAAEVISARILWAAGYNVPENYVLTFRLNRFVLTDGATTGGRYGSTVPLTEEALQDLISLVNPFPDGRVQALFSRLLPGKPIGPFSYEGVRSEDPNDRIPHERRRSLRGLKMFSAWLNNVDTVSANTLDMFIADGESDLGHIQHYLLDFGNALGSMGTKPKYLGLGYEGLLDWTLTLRELFTAGLWYRYWLPIERSPYRSVGVFEAQVFDPERWRPAIPNPAFDAAGPLDDFWAAALIARFDVEQLIAVVEAGEYQRAGATSWVLRVLLQRQFAIARSVFARVLPLGPPVMEGPFVMYQPDLGVRVGLEDADRVGYRYRVHHHPRRGPSLLLAEGENFVPRVDLTEAVRAAQQQISPATLASEPFISVTWTQELPQPRRPQVRVHLRILRSSILPVALERDVR